MGILAARQRADALLIALGMNFYGYWNSDKLALRAMGPRIRHSSQEVQQRLEVLAGELHDVGFDSCGNRRPLGPRAGCLSAVVQRQGRLVIRQGQRVDGRHAVAHSSQV